MTRPPVLMMALSLAFAPMAASAQTAPPPPAQESFTITPGQVSAAEREFRDRALQDFRAASRTGDERLNAIRAVRPEAQARNLGRTAVLTPRTPFVENVAWLNAELVTSNAESNIFSMLVWADDFAPLGSFDVVIKAQAGKRYLVECSAQSFGASATQATVFASDDAAMLGAPLLRERFNVSAPGSVISVVTPQANGPYLRVSLGIDPKAIDKGGLSVLVLDKCEITPFT